MRRQLACVLAVCVVVPAGFARGGEDEEARLRAEVRALREENARLQEQLKGLSSLVREWEQVLAVEAKLEGTWVIESATRDGIVRKQDVGGEIAFRGNRIDARMAASQAPIRVALRLSPSTKQIGFDRLPGAAAAPTHTPFDLVNGLYVLNGDTLRISLQSAYSIPKSISDTDQILWVLKRKTR